VAAPLGDHHSDQEEQHQAGDLDDHEDEARTSRTVSAAPTSVRIFTTWRASRLRS